MVFDIKNYAENTTVMHCPKESDYEIFSKYLDSIGRQWNNGNSYIYRNNYNRYKTLTCLNFTQGTFGDLDYYINMGYRILEFDDFDWCAPEESEYEISEEEERLFTCFLNGFKVI